MKRDPAYSEFIRSQPCCACCRPPRSEQHHCTGAGMALRSDDRDSMPLCTQCHRDFHAAAGQFRGWVKRRRRWWQGSMANKFQRLYRDKQEAW